jgi:hypothetical protein
MGKIRHRTLAVLALSLLSLVLVTVDWRASVLIAILAAVMAIANLRSAE